MVIKIFNNKISHFFLGIFIKFSACGVHLQFRTIKVCCWQKNFGPRIKLWNIPQQLLVSVEAYLYIKNQTCCFESLRTRLTTSTWNYWINVLLLLLGYHMCFLGPLVISKNLTSHLKFFVRYCSLKNLVFWLVLRFLDHNSRTRFFANMLFLQKVKRTLEIRTEVTNHT